jgi:predicted phosphodiesterase
VAGDLCLDGADPAGVVDFLRDRGWPCVQGNTDWDLATSQEDAAPLVNEQLTWTRERLGAERLSWLGQLPLSLRASHSGAEDILVCHANPRNRDEKLAPGMTEEELEPYLRGVEEPIVAFGHIHIPYIRPVRRTLLLDVSSAGFPKDGDRRAAYTVITWDGERRSVTQVRLAYDIEESIRRLRASGFPGAEEQAAALLKASY